jgi:hypothetical protein
VSRRRVRETTKLFPFVGVSGDTIDVANMFEFNTSAAQPQHTGQASLAGFTEAPINDDICPVTVHHFNEATPKKGVNASRFTEPRPRPKRDAG